MLSLRGAVSDEAISVFGQRLLRSAAQKQNLRLLPDAHGSPSFRASTARPGIQAPTLDSGFAGMVMYLRRTLDDEIPVAATLAVALTWQHEACPFSGE